MNVKQTILTSALLVAISLMGAQSAFALTAAQAKAIKTAVTSVPVPEMPAKAADLVSKAAKEDREAVAVTAVRAILLRNKAAAPVVVSAIIKAAPEVASVVTANAVELAGEQESSIIRAAMVSAPDQARQIAAYSKKTTVMARASSSESFAGGIVSGAQRSVVRGEAPIRGAGDANTPQGTVDIDTKDINGNTFPVGTPTKTATAYEVDLNTPPN